MLKHGGPATVSPSRPPDAAAPDRTKGATCGGQLASAGSSYLILVFTLGLTTLRNGHGWMFFFGIFLPVLWVIGAFMRPSERRFGSS